ncbi:MAG: hypothetical protein GX096_14490 [Clostridiales bacterium]|nr:hypothetical protein [Clostridiales bacterium]
MQKYKQKTPIASVTDKLLRAIVASGIGIAWFVYLWGLSLPALTAGFAMGGLIWLCARLFSKKSVEKRELQMRRMIGGEIALNKLLLLPPRHAAFQATIWLLPKESVQMVKAIEWGILGTLDDKEVMVRLIAQHESMPINVQQIITVIKETREHKVESCILCLTAPLSRDAAQYLETSDLSVRIVQREELMLLAGLSAPATDEDLSKLARKKHTHRNAKQWLDMVLSPTRCKRYFWFGMGLGLLALLTGQWVYPIPAAICLALFAASKAKEFHLEHKKA